MKKIIVLLLSVALFSCTDKEKEQLETDLQVCNSEKEGLIEQVAELEQKVAKLESELEDSQSDLEQCKSDLDDCELNQD